MFEIKNFFKFMIYIQHFWSFRLSIPIKVLLLLVLISNIYFSY
jgi:hypothetical protein